MNNPTLIISAAALVAVVLVIFLFWRKVPADKAMVITGLKKRVLSGRGGLMIPFLETSCVISLENMSMTTDVNEAPSKQGIFVNIVGTAVIKVKNDAQSIYAAVEQFCSGGARDSVGTIKSIVEQILEGKLRGIISTLTVEQINEDRASFEQRIEADIRAELESMGLMLVSYTILKISTQGGYLENRAIPQIAQAKSDADIATAERKRDTEIKTADAVRIGQKAKLEADTAIAESERDKAIKVESYRAEQDRAKADADIAYKLRAIENERQISEQEAELARKNAIVVEEKLVAEVKKPADAKKYEAEVKAEADKIAAIKMAQAEAESIKIKAEAEAEAIIAKGRAEAEAIKAKGLADAEAKNKLAEAMSKYEEAAIVELLVSRMPEIVKEAARPMEQVDKITIIDNGGNGGASKVSKIVTDVTANGFQVLKDVTGLDVVDLIRKASNKEADAKMSDSEKGAEKKDEEEKGSKIIPASEIYNDNV